MSRRRKPQHRRPRAGGWTRGPRGHGPGGPGAADPRGRATGLLVALAAGPGVPGRRSARAALAALPIDDVLAAARPLLEAMVTSAWASGWQPAELVWHARRAGSAAAGTVTTAAVRDGAAALPSAGVHPSWRDQLDDLGAVLGADPSAAVDHLGRTVAAQPDPAGALSDAVTVLGVLPPLQVLLPVPGRPDITVEVVASGDGSAPEGIDPKVLAKVRALLAKAEATTYEAEAQAFTAKAHELMTRHSLEHVAVARSAPGARAVPVARRLRLDDPYADAKALLVQVIADASRCRAVQHPGVQMSTVVGFEADLAAVEVLFTSLLVQAQTALQELAGRTAAGSRERTRGFRSSFLRGFAHRIGERLDAAGEATVADLDRESGGALVPVLAEREAEVDDRLSQLFPRLRTKRSRGSVDGLGYRAGAAAAERADLPWAQVRG